MALTAPPPQEIKFLFVLESSHALPDLRAIFGPIFGGLSPLAFPRAGARWIKRAMRACSCQFCGKKALIWRQIFGA